MRRFLLLLLLGAGVLAAPFLSAGEPLPPAPTQYVTDTTGSIPAPLVAQLNQRLADFERQTSSQIVAVVSRSLPEGTTLDDYAQSLYHAWKIGTKKNSNGVLILIFTQDRKIRIQPGYGLEGALPDALCSRIIRETMSPAFRAGNYGAGLSAGISAVMQATKGEYKGEYKGNGRTGSQSAFKDLLFSPLGFFLFVLLLLAVVGRSRRDLGPDGVNPGAAAATGFLIGGLGGMGGGSGGGDSGGFSGGGGDSGGGGASGDW